MPKQTRRTPTIVGNLPVDSVTVNMKGGSLAAILKTSIRGGLAEGEVCYGANLEFEPGVSCVLVAPGQVAGKRREKHPRKFRVMRVSQHRYVVDLESEDEEVIDPVTKATLKILEEMLKADKLTLLSEDEVKERLSKMEKEGAKIVSEARRKAHEPKMK